LRPIDAPTRLQSLMSRSTSKNSLESSTSLTAHATHSCKSSSCISSLQLPIMNHTRGFQYLPQLATRGFQQSASSLSIHANFSAHAKNRIFTPEKIPTHCCLDSSCQTTAPASSLCHSSLVAWADTDPVFGAAAASLHPAFLPLVRRKTGGSCCPTSHRNSKCLPAVTARVLHAV
jgi:hypothetical protein